MVPVVVLLAALPGSMPQVEAVADEPTVRRELPFLEPLPAGSIRLGGWLGSRTRLDAADWLAEADLGSWLATLREPGKPGESGEPAENAAIELAGWLRSAAAVAATEPAGELAMRLADAVDDVREALAESAGGRSAAILRGLLDVHAANADPRLLAAVQRGVDRLGEATEGASIGLLAELHRRSPSPHLLAIARARAERPVPAAIAGADALALLEELCGRCELARVLGSRQQLEPVLEVWQELVDRELSITGSLSRGGILVGGGRLPGDEAALPGPTCVTVAWLELNALLFELLGEARFAREIERTANNQLIAVQAVDGRSYCSTAPLRGRRRSHAQPACHASSGPRGLAMIPGQSAFRAPDDALVIALLETANGVVRLDGRRVGFAIRNALPAGNAVAIDFSGEVPARFAVRLRLSDWCLPARVECGDWHLEVETEGFCEIPRRTWLGTEIVRVTFADPARVLHDRHDDEREAFAFGPHVLALDAGLVELPLRPVRVGPLALPRHDGRAGLGFRATFAVDDLSRVLPMTSFAEAGAAGSEYRTWFARGRPVDPAVAESRSRPGNVAGSIIDGDRDSYVVTNDGQPGQSDWFAIRFGNAQAIRAVRFVHGRASRDGGWFDTRDGKPKVEVRGGPGEDWRVVGALEDYPATTAKDPGRLVDRQCFELGLDLPVQAWELRVVGRPASGDRPDQSFASCAELQALR